MLVKMRSKHTQHFVKGLFEEIGTQQVMSMFKRCAIKSFLHGLYLIQEEAKHAGLDLGIPATYFDVNQKHESKDYITCKKRVIKQSRNLQGKSARRSHQRKMMASQVLVRKSFL